MKIAFLNDGAYAYASGSSRAVGGAERDQWLLARALVAAGWTATVGVRARLTAGERRVIDGVEYVGIGQRQVLLSWRSFLREERPNWLFWECAYYLWGPLVEIAKLDGVRTIFHLGHDRDVQPRQALLRRRRWWPLYAWGLSRTDRIFVQHGEQLSGLSRRLRAKASVLPKVCVFEGNGAHRIPAKPHGERAKYVAWVARLVEPKRPDVLIEIARKAPGIRFVVCGGPSSSSRNYANSIIDELSVVPNIEYLGHVAPEKAQQVIADAAIFLSTSDAEGFPNTFTQAWSAGTPVLSLRVDPDHIIERVGLGTVSGKLEQAIADINALMDSPEWRDEISSRARRFVAENYSASAVVRLFEHALDGVHR